MPWPDRLRRNARRLVAMALAGVLAGTLTDQPAFALPGGAAALGAPPTPQSVPAVPVSNVAWSAPPVIPNSTDTLPAASNPPAEWPEGGSALVSLAAPASSSATTDSTAAAKQAAKAGGLDLKLGALASASSSARDVTGSVPLKQVRVEVLDRAATAKAGVTGVVMKVARTDGSSAAGKIALSVDYKAFAGAYGADWASRLRLVSLPACALTTPEERACAGTPLTSTNDVKAKAVSASVAVSSAGSVVALAAAPSGPAGNYAATSLQASATWAAGGNSGAFTWSYPMRVPPSAGGLGPQVGISYNSQSVDGRHAASNNQPSWVGEGFDASAGGQIERRYTACATDMDGDANNDVKNGDQCWETNNAVLSLAGHSGELIYNSTEGRWHLRSDDGTRIERKTGATNGDDNGEHWVVTTPDGTQYWFGLNRLPGWASGDPVTESAWTLPVYGNDPNEPCHATAFEDSDCVQAYRWNLDYVVDVNGNSMSYWYVKETNKYGRNLDSGDAPTYVRGGYLDRVDYGTRQDGGVDSVLDTPAPQRVDLGVANRCVSNCSTKNATNWPDVPWDSECTGTPCDNYSPTFWTSKRLATVTTQIRSGSSYANVERWTLRHSFPDPGDGTRAGLWLAKLSHEGLNGTTVTVPDIEFAGIQLANRVDTIDHSPAMNWWRVARVRNETGGTLNVVYSGPDCVAGSTPTAETNSKRCYPVRWTPEGATNPKWDWFHKYVVTDVYEIDHTGGAAPQGSPRIAYHYTYYDGAAWHYNDDDGLIDAKDKTWSDYRGYSRVGVTTGDPDEPSRTYTETRFFRGMHGDKAAPSGGTRTVTVTGTGVTTVNDEDAYAGMVRETTVFNGPGGAVVSRDVNEPWQSAATATRTFNGDTVTARYVVVKANHKRIARDGGRADRVTSTVSTFDNYGMAVQVEDLGDTAVTGDETCTKSTFEPRNTTAWILNKPHTLQTYAATCSATTGTLTEAQIITEHRMTYDDNAYLEAPDKGLAVKVDTMSAWNSGTPTFITKSRAAYDAHGRTTTSWNALNVATTTAYTPATGGPVTGTTVTNALGHVITTTLDPAYGSPTSIVDANLKRTDLAYDALGSLTSVWLPGRDKATKSANMTYSYLLRTNAPTVVTTKELNASEQYVTTYALFDGLLRERQSQSPSPSGGRIITESFYDSVGHKVKAYGAYYATGSPGTSLVTATQRTDVPSQFRTVFDGVSRPTAEIFQPYDVERWRTTTAYGGDRLDVTPPAGGTATSTVLDAQGRTRTLRMYTGATPTPYTTGTWDETNYTYNAKGQLGTVTDAVGNQWIHTYDLLGREIQTVDPDKGTTKFGYNNEGQLTSTELNGKKLFFSLDVLGRKRSLREDTVSGTLRAQWTYDNIAKGLLSTSTRLVGTAAYQTKILEYNDNYQPVSTQISIPSTETGLSGTYVYNNTFNAADGSLASTTVPGMPTGGLPVETLSFTYSSLGLLTSMSSLYGSPGTNMSLVQAVAYNALGQTDQLTFDTDATAGGRVWQSFTRELDTGRTTAIRTDRDNVAPYTVADVRYAYDNAGNIKKVTDVSPDPVDDTQCFTYDYLQRLTEAWTPTSGDCNATKSTAALGGPAPYWHAWELDKTGNRKKLTVRTSTMNYVTDYQYPATGSSRPHAVSSSSGAQVAEYRYDANGNTVCRPVNTGTNDCDAATPTTAGSQVLTWDPEGHLATSTDSSGATTYIYDAEGNRLVRRDPTGKTLYLPGQEVRYTTASQAVTGTRYYAFGDKTIASRDAAGLTWLNSDHQGTSQVAIRQSDQQVTTRRQVPYGASRGAAVTWPNTRGFVGGVNDNTGLVHLGAREYDQATGRFISVDPAMDLADPQHWNGYSYANNSPITLSDPSGLEPGSWCNDNACSVVTGQSQTSHPMETGFDANGNARKKKAPDIDPKEYARAYTEWSRIGCTRMPIGGLTNPLSPCLPSTDAQNQVFADAENLYLLAKELGLGYVPLLNCDYCDYLDAQAAAGFKLLGTLLGVDDYIDCFKGKWSGCAWVAVGFVGYGLGKAVTALKNIKRLRGLATKLDDIPKFCPVSFGSNSFSADTPVLLADGTTKPIDEIRVGDIVVATDPATGEQGPRLVTNIWVHDDILVDLVLQNGLTISTTEDHLFWNETDQQWQEAQFMDKGDRVLALGMSTVAVDSLNWKTIHRAAAYNLTVDDLHTYYVLAGSTPVLVHNDGGWEVPDDFVIVRGGQSAMAGPGEVFSGSMGTTVSEAGAAVPHGSIRVTTAGAIRAAGGTVVYAPEVGPGGAMNNNHVNVTLGDNNPFGELENNPVAKADRMTPEALGKRRC
ncbi:RHS repeat-associated core domain-containing protein [Luedemannella flava]